MEVAGALVQLVEQPPVLDRDHRLIGERLQEVDLRRRKRLDLAARGGKRPNRIAVPQDRHREGGMRSRLNDGGSRDNRAR
ncbi:MAG TPA: hypothetical protein VNF04_05865 [Stellaceae bacterium]|nr:hypothetical protein [Stellaceae bacterium]